MADEFGVSLKRLVLDNLEDVKDPAAPLGGRTILLCNAKEVAAVLPPTSQADALLRIKAAIDPNNLLTLWSMRPDSKPTAYCAWTGVTCDERGNVVSIVLADLDLGTQKLGGVLPSADQLLALPQLVNLRIVRQDLVGTLPDDYSKLTQLTDLLLWDNQLHGTLPVSWAAMKSLRVLVLGSFIGTTATPVGNRLTSPLPAEWGSLANLRQLSLPHNRLTGTLPASWGALRLEVLQLNSNNFKGSIPDSWAPLVTGNMYELAMSGLSGTLPAAW